MSTPSEVNQKSIGLWRPERKSIWVKILIIIIVLVTLFSVLSLWQLFPFNHQESTDNAYVKGRTMHIAPQVSGYVAEVLVSDYQHVKAGQVIVKIDDRIYKAKVDQAKANYQVQLAQLSNNKQALTTKKVALQSQLAGVDNAYAQLNKASADMNRVNELVQDGSVSIKERDQTVATIKQSESQLQQAIASRNIASQDIKTVQVNRDVLKAQLDSAKAQLQLAEIDLSNTVVRATENGQVGEVGVRLGQYVTNGTVLVPLVPYDRWLIANFKESQTSKMQIGQKVSFTVDALNNAEFKGKVQQISPAAGSEFSVLKPDNATGNFVKVPQRIGVRIAINPNQPLYSKLRPGMSTQLKIIVNGSAD
jgi:multidrug resistance efflux pump